MPKKLSEKKRIFVIQEHDASSLHDENDNLYLLKSWMRDECPF